ncbi:hypothetical protein BDN72DRAFT_763099 [Pluteus cervinus]|uniref:Uncharacterized protein n=1 Tax=Pluteus cervinus TaxID=181527 RepID=A0ACD3B4I3_9AGAR|nr:hypothetical protein BDN72DRAFT_763099 [Pluteus cervinus]
MKFNDGFWLLKSGIKPFYGLSVVDAKRSDEGYIFQVSTRPIRHRGDTLGGPILSVEVHSPTEGVIGVKISHFAQIRTQPGIPLFPDEPPLANRSFHQDDAGFHLTAGDLSAHVTENPYTVTFKSSTRVLTFAGPKYQALFDVPFRWALNNASNSSCLTSDPAANPYPEKHPDIIRYLHSELNLSPGELLFGFGEQFGAFVKNGQSISIWNQDGGTSSEQAYKCVPFYITNRNYGVFINNPGEVEVEVGSEKVSRVGVSVAAGSLEYFIIYGANPLDILEKYTRLTGRPALLPSWTFGLWLSTSFLTSYSTETVSGFLEGMRERNCPVRVFHLDCFWMKQYEWCSFSFDSDNFPDPKAYLAGIKDKYNVKVCLWINPYVSQLSPIFTEGLEGGYFIKRTNGIPWQWDLWQPGLAVVDITNPAAREWYATKLKALLDLGVDTFKTDFGERIPHASVVYHDGSDPMRMHNTYSVLYNELVFNVLKERFGNGEAVVFARASAAGGQRFPVHWGGDCESTWEAMAEALRGALSLTLSGFAFASHDIGGFEGHPPPEIYQRWVAFGLFSSHSRLHGSSSYRVPWQYGEEAAKTMADLLEARHRLMPYLYNTAIQAHLKGHPMMRAMFLEFQGDRTTHYLDRQYLLGPSLLVAPVLTPLGEDTEYYIPAGRWTSFFNPQSTVTGPLWIKEQVPINEIPVWVRPGTVLCLGPPGIGRPDYDYSHNVNVQLYEIAESQVISTDVPLNGGANIAGTIHVRRDGDIIGVSIERAQGSNLKVSDITVFDASGHGREIVEVVGGEVIPSSARLLQVKVDDGQKEVRIKLA